MYNAPVARYLLTTATPFWFSFEGGPYNTTPRRKVSTWKKTLGGAAKQGGWVGLGASYPSLHSSNWEKGSAETRRKTTGQAWRTHLWVLPKNDTWVDVDEMHGVGTRVSLTTRTWTGTGDWDRDWSAQVWLYPGHADWGVHLLRLVNPFRRTRSLSSRPRARPQRA